MFSEDVMSFHEIEFAEIDLRRWHACIHQCVCILLPDAPVEGVEIDALEIIGLTLANSPHRLPAEVEPCWIQTRLALGSETHSWSEASVSAVDLHFIIKLIII